jgi:hypothetical protein
MILHGVVYDGCQHAGPNLRRVLSLIEQRSKMQPLIEYTLNVRLRAQYIVEPAFVITRDEYNGAEELRFQFCKLADVPCLIMRPDSHELGHGHGPTSIELMSTVWLRKTLGLATGSAGDGEGPG